MPCLNHTNTFRFQKNMQKSQQNEKPFTLFNKQMDALWNQHRFPTTQTLNSSKRNWTETILQVAQKKSHSWLFQATERFCPKTDQSTGSQTCEELANTTTSASSLVSLLSEFLLYNSREKRRNQKETSEVGAFDDAQHEAVSRKLRRTACSILEQIRIEQGLRTAFVRFETRHDRIKWTNRWL